MRTAFLGAAISAALITLTACGSANDADVAFAQRMIPHHAQAVEMADLVDGRTTNPEVVELATAVKKAQQPEIDTLTGWLEAWGEPVEAGHSGHSGDDMAGMVDTSALTGLTGADFDRAWLTAMVEHHEGALDMANQQLSAGSDDKVKQFAAGVFAAQRAEIDEMKALLERG
ncbi:DUF305 domain-containing protein [Umezawaea endophytica]|uniref:DUF305 domain-containing protein n=1 Tax=Umezawaea endophytica TaxID=1654476 RepID=A0A9X2VJ22_9PSEU|nr:DUF305 domain-containing protein [Umezawaea endophytica]MCS7476018.1 DUF305 domain-containing protein [Umezawaea endophytica]